jgi:hypothetical protein
VLAPLRRVVRLGPGAVEGDVLTLWDTQIRQDGRLAIPDVAKAFSFGRSVGSDTSRRFRNTVSTLKKSVSTIADACARRNAFHVCRDLDGAGPILFRRSNLRIAVAETT